MNKIFKTLAVTALTFSTNSAVMANNVNEGYASESDIENLQAQIDGLKVSVAQASSDAASAQSAASDAASKAAAAESAANRAAQYAQDTNSKLDKLLKKSINDLIDFSALTGEYLVGNPGFETIVPYWNKVDHDRNGFEDGYDFHFDVFKMGTKTKLFSTPVRYLPYVLSACINPKVDRRDVDFKRIGNNIVLSSKLYTYCGSSQYTGHIYAVNISAAGNTPWVKLFSGKLIGTGILPDSNRNGAGELSVVVQTGGYNNTDNTLYIYDSKTGTSLVMPQKYAVDR